MHGDGGKVVECLEHLTVVRVPGHGAEPLGDRGLRAGADLTIAETGRQGSYSV